MKVKNHLLKITITSKKIDSSTIYPSRQQIDSQTQKISNEKKCCLIKINGNNNITIKPLTQKDSVEISVESKNNSDIKNNAREERGIATNTTEDICDAQNDSNLNRIKIDTKKPDNQLYHNLSRDKKTIANLIHVTKMGAIVETLNSNKKKFYVLPKNLRSS